MLSREAGKITYGTRMIEQDRINLSVQVDLGNCSVEAFIASTDVTALTNGVIWFEDNFYIPTGVTEFSFTEYGMIYIWTWNVDTWDEETFTAVEYDPSPGPITEISDGVTHDGTHFLIPTGVTSFTFEDDGVEWEATFDVTWSFAEVTSSATPFEGYFEQTVDDFNSYANNDRLHNFSNWDLLIVQSEGMSAFNAPHPNIAVRAGSMGTNAAYNTNENQSADQYAGFTIYSIVGEFTRNGVFLRGSNVSGASFYGLSVNSDGDLVLEKSVDGSFTIITTFNLGIETPTNDVEYTLSVIGNELRVYENGILLEDSSLDSVFIDNDISNGRYGVYGIASNGPLIDNFRAGSLNNTYQIFS